MASVELYQKHYAFCEWQDFRNGKTIHTAKPSKHANGILYIQYSEIIKANTCFLGNFLNISSKTSYGNNICKQFRWGSGGT